MKRHAWSNIEVQTRRRKDMMELLLEYIVTIVNTERSGGVERGTSPNRINIFIDPAPASRRYSCVVTVWYAYTDG